MTESTSGCHRVSEGYDTRNGEVSVMEVFQAVQVDEVEDSKDPSEKMASEQNTTAWS